MYRLTFNSHEYGLGLLKEQNILFSFDLPARLHDCCCYAIRVGLLGGDARLLCRYDVYLLSSQDYTGELFYADGRRSADVQRPVRRGSTVAAYRAS